MRVAYFYLMANDPDRVRAVAPQHAAYWRALSLAGYLGGPFADRSGGLILFTADSTDQADRLVAGDPFVREALVDESWTKEWVPD